MIDDWPPDEGKDWPPPKAEVSDADMLDRACAGLAAGTPLPKLLRDMGVSETRFWQRHGHDILFREQVQAARVIGIERLADEILSIADSNRMPDTKRVMIDARKWLLAKLMPKRYGDKLELGVTAMPPIEEQSDDELRQRLAVIRATRAARSAGGADPAGDDRATEGEELGATVH